MFLSDYADYINPAHLLSFKEAAREFQVYILIRKTNRASLQYMGKAGYTGKRLDCKWKTANRDVGPYRLAGLVASPQVHPDAFVANDGKKGKKFQNATQEWAKHQELIFYPQGSEDIERLDLRGCRKPYAIQLNPRHKHYGCVAFIEDGIVFPRYIYADYDLYALVDAHNPGVRNSKSETMLNSPHVYGPKWFRIMNWMDARFSYPMIFHGEQEHFKEHEKDDLIVFFPDGRTVRLLSGLSEIRDFYGEELMGREPYRKPATRKSGLVRH